MTIISPGWDIVVGMLSSVLTSTFGGLADTFFKMHEVRPRESFPSWYTCGWGLYVILGPVSAVPMLFLPLSLWAMTSTFNIIASEFFSWAFLDTTLTKFQMIVMAGLLTTVFLISLFAASPDDDISVYFDWASIMILCILVFKLAISFLLLVCTRFSSLPPIFYDVVASIVPAVLMSSSKAINKAFFDKAVGVFRGDELTLQVLLLIPAILILGLSALYAKAYAMGKFNNVNVVPLYFSFGIVYTALLGVVYFHEIPKNVTAFIIFSAVLLALNYLFINNEERRATSDNEENLEPGDIIVVGSPSSSTILQQPQIIS